MINCVKKRVLATVLLAVTALTGCAEWRSDKTMGQNIDDTNIVASVKAKLTADSHVSAKNITVNSHKGTVQLSGFVHDANAKSQAQLLATHVKGVRKVINNLVVSTPAAHNAAAVPTTTTTPVHH